MGFSTGEPWLPLGEGHRELTVDREEAEPESLLHFTRACLRLRRVRPALRHGSMELVEAGEQKLVFDRIAPGEKVRCTFNLSDRPVPFRSSGLRLIGAGDIDEHQLGAYAAIIEEMA